jgi:negative regulator of flagellin synthesis FlgM
MRSSAAARATAPPVPFEFGTRIAKVFPKIAVYSHQETHQGHIWSTDVKIEGNSKGLLPPQVGENRTRNTTPQPAAQGAPGDTVEISAMSPSLARAEASMASTPVVNQARVDEIRQAISEGRFRIDANRIADGLLDSVREMLGRSEKA